MKGSREDGNIVPMSCSGVAEMNSKTRFLLSSVEKNSASQFFNDSPPQECQCILTST